jgi:hypothetical protein
LLVLYCLLHNVDKILRDDGSYWRELRVWRFLAKYEAERDKTSTFVESNVAVHLFMKGVTAIAVAVIDIFTKASRPRRENWVLIQLYIQGVPLRPVTFLK